MSDDNVYEPKPTQRDDLRHVDTVASDQGPISTRVGRDPANLGNEIPVAGDITTPSPDNEVPSGGDLTHPSSMNEPLGK